MKTRLLYCYVFVAVIFSISILNLVFRPTVQYADDVPPPVLTMESLTSGQFFTSFEDYFQKRFMFRLSLVEAYNSISTLKGITTEDSIQIVKINDDNLAEAAVQAAASSAPAPHTVESAFNVVEENWGQLLIYRQMGMGVAVNNREACLGLADAINAFKKAYPMLNISVLISPTKAEMILQDSEIPSYSQKENIALVYQNLDPAIRTIDIYSKLIDHRSEYIFFNTDHHWTPKGAYYAYTEYMTALGRTYIDSASFDVTQLENFLGSYYTMTLSDELKQNPDKLEVYNVAADCSASIYDENGVLLTAEARVIDPEYVAAVESYMYNIYLDGDHPLVKITTHADGDDKLLIIKDSFANAFVPFLTAHYKEIYMVDARLFKGDLQEIIDTNGIEKLLFLNNALRMNNDTYEQVLRAVLALQPKK